MRTIKRSNAFKRDYRRERSGMLGPKLDALLVAVIELLIADLPMPPRFADHPLAGEWKDHRDCHVSAGSDFDLSQT